MTAALRTHLVGGPPRLAVDVAGHGPLVVLLHGMGGDRSTWRAQFEALAPEYQVASLDLRGYGDSAPIVPPLDFLADFSQDVIAVLDHFGAPQAHLVGLSMGGRVARATALRHPHRVASLTLANTSAGFDALPADQVERFVAERSRGLETGLLPAGFGLEQARHMMAPGTPAATLRIAAEAMQRLRPRHYLAVLAASTRQDRCDRLEDIRCPTLVIDSDQDRVYPPAVTGELVTRIPGARHVRIEGAGHLSPIEQPQAFNRALLSFLHSQTPSRQAGRPGLPT